MSGDPLFVESINGKTALLSCPKARNKISANIEDLMVVKPFGEAIFPCLTLVGKLDRGNGPAAHSVISAENYHALQLLVYMYEAKMDCIYIDPPYNTGASDWTYNNRFVDSNDSYRHSKWLSFIEKRLRLAKRLLKPDGVLVITVDEHEVHHLGMLLEKIFSDFQRQMITIVTNPKGATRGGFSRVEEYAFCCFRQVTSIEGRGDDLLTPDVADIIDDENENRPRWKGLLRSGNEARRQDRENMFYPVLIDRERHAVVGTGDPLPIGENPDWEADICGYAAAWPIRRDGSLGRWSVGHVLLRSLISKGYVAAGNYDPKRKTWAISYLSETPQAQIAAGVLKIHSFDELRNVVDVRYSDIASRRIKTGWHSTRHDAGAGGSDVLTAFLGERRFAFPKSVYAVQDALSAVVRSNPNALILDFFAGSGTTLHATCLLNAADGGTRRCILVTNNEVDADTAASLNAIDCYRGDPEFDRYGIFERVCRPRCEAVITGLRPDGKPVSGVHLNGRRFAHGFEENVIFYRLDYLDPDEVSLGRQFAAILPLLWLTTGGAGGPPRHCSPNGPWVMPADSSFGVLIDPDHFSGFRRQLQSRPDVTHVWIVTDDDQAFARMRSEISGAVRVRMLYREYLRNFAINTDRNV
jgi:adenine-specific DNA-methyltransferase